MRMRMGAMSALLLVSTAAQVAVAQIPPITKVIVMPSYAMPAPVMQATAAAITEAMGSASVEAIRRSDECVDGGFESDACRALLTTHGADTLIIVTYYPVDASRDTAVLSLGMYGSAQVGVRGELPSEAEARNVSDGLIRQALAQWPEAHKVEVVFEGTPVGAAVRIHGGTIESLPARFRLSAGTHHATVTSPGFVAEEREFEVQLGEPELLRVDLARSVGGALPDPIAPPTPNSESAWPSYVLGGVLVATGGALLVSPIRTAIHSGECEDCSGPDIAQTSFGGRSIALTVVGAAATLGGVLMLAGRWWTVGGAADTRGMSVQLRGSF